MKPLLVGEANPYQSDPRLAQRYALYPDPPRCAGWNLCHTIMQLDEGEYLSRFDRVNLCDGKWSTREAKDRALKIRGAALTHLSQRQVVVLCGSKVTQAFFFKYDPFSSFPFCGRQYVVLPHPSGLSRAWNEPGAHERARAVLREAGVL